MRWDPAQYNRYADERGRPFLDLLGRVGAQHPRRVVDVGCGPGTLTALLPPRWPAAVVEGLDSSPEMIASAEALSGPRLSFRVADAASWEVPADTDVIVSNALLQWVPGHLDLLRAWATMLPADGWLAAQVPGNFESPSHVLMRELASSPRWAAALEGVLRHQNVADPQTYAALLLDAGLVADVWDTTYLHVLHGPDPVLEWLRGTGLRPVLAALSPADGAEFEQAFAAELRQAYPATEHGTLLPFRRIFLVGHRA
ncbi:trans-aconitate 2-methyltransferase [Jatrophihabitans sp.]|uniref:trans-aconitate 2-methyltransferase n=1 Tax=Jatrophihabitans sp. TaxID=1932789 RepID=UPI0030C6DEEC|nr:trans-aconitate methyltransferase [Jatrophihabitans sp.]